MILLTNYEEAVRIAKQGYKIEDALELLNSGMSSEETIKVLKKKKKKIEREKQRKRDEELGDLMLQVMFSKLIARRDKKREWRKSCVNRWGSLADKVKKQAQLTHMFWYIFLPILTMLVATVSLMTPEANLKPQVVAAIGYGMIAFIVINMVRIIPHYDEPDAMIQKLWMTRWMFRRWANRMGSRAFVHHDGEVDEKQLANIVGEKKAAKVICKREKVQTKRARKKQESEKLKEERMRLARQYCPDEAEAEKLYKEATYHDGIWILALFLVLCFGGIGAIGWVCCACLSGPLVGIWTIAFCLLWVCVVIAIVYGAVSLVGRFFWDYERTIKRIIRKRAISRVMGEEESNEAEQENCSV